MATQTNLDDFLGAKPVPRWRKWLKWILLGVAVVIVLFVLSRVFGTTAKPSYATVAVTQAPLRVTVSATGNLAPTNQVEVGAELSGRIIKVLVDVNDRVTVGQPIAVIDPSNFEDTVRQNEASVASAVASVRQNEATVAEAKATLDRQEEVSRLSGGRVPAKTELDTARANYQRALATLAAARASVQQNQAQLSAGRTQLTRTTIRSPVNGVVLARQIEPGQTVAASFSTPTLFVIAEDLSQMKLEVAVDEADVAGVVVGQEASFTVDAFPGRSFPAQITRVDQGSSLTAGTSSTTTTTSSTSTTVISYAATLSVANRDLQLRPGMTATAEIVTASKPNALQVPNAALRFKPATTDAAGAKSGGSFADSLMPRPRRDAAQKSAAGDTAKPGQQTVYILGADGTPQPVKIATGLTNGSQTEVIGGDLKPGMKVITGQLSSSASGGASVK
ncbi:efflux RND transporter periplasmic adaptor subunit [Sphingomonas hengshuiensis]|uniref:Secretion protein HlyD n=1 Tax=Sphingomonas hengshuiensis TaxID=1609977 RepID=A0A7U4JBM3_9SPHN|nr:efflux RND transporter periplasmic adaptor subunit [Sphingomonas hengshuiensis]AJP73833.1 secretion protein HlyD [Sphingomonas hengshuiensis]